MTLNKEQQQTIDTLIQKVKTGELTLGGVAMELKQRLSK